MWQYIFGIELYWIVPALAIILLLAVGADYNLLLISRFKEEIGAGLNTGIIRAMAGTGGVVTAAGLVFAVTMASFAFSDLIVLGQIGTTIALGLLFDTLIVRSFMTPSIAAMLGRWFWWPLNVRTRPASQMLQPFGSRSRSGIAPFVELSIREKRTLGRAGYLIVSEPSCRTLLVLSPACGTPTTVRQWSCLVGIAMWNRVAPHAQWRLAAVRG